MIVLVGLLSRHGFCLQAWWDPDIFLWMDKWTLGPLRLLNFAAWTGLLLAWNPAPAQMVSRARGAVGAAFIGRVRLPPCRWSSRRPS